MKKLTITLSSICFLLLFSQSVVAADRVMHFPVKEAMNSNLAQEKLNSGVKFYFGTQKSPGIQKRYGTDVANKRTNSFLKGDQAACNHVFLSSMIALQARAQSLGANAVVNIVSYFKKKTYSSTTDFECHIGTAMSAVTLKGDFVRTR